MTKLEYYAHKLNHYITMANQSHSPKRLIDGKLTEEQYRYDTDILKKIEQDYLFGLYLFVKNHPTLTNSQIWEVLKCCQCYDVLNNLSIYTQNLISNIRDLGFSHTCSLIIDNKTNENFSFYA